MSVNQLDHGLPTHAHLSHLHNPEAMKSMKPISWIIKIVLEIKNEKWKSKLNQNDEAY